MNLGRAILKLMKLPRALLMLVTFFVTSICLKPNHNLVVRNPPDQQRFLHAMLHEASTGDLCSAISNEKI